MRGYKIGRGAIKMRFRKMVTITFLYLKNMYSMAALFVVLFVLLSGGIDKHARSGMATPISMDNKCQNSLTVLTKDVISVIVNNTDQLNGFWELCKRAGSSLTGESPDPKIGKICQSTKFNIDLLCNTYIAEEQQRDVVDIWANQPAPLNICEGRISIMVFA